MHFVRSYVRTMAQTTNIISDFGKKLFRFGKYWYRTVYARVHTYYRSRIKCLPFVPKIQLKRVCGLVKNGAHTILKIWKRQVSQIFCFFSMVWGDLDVTRGVWVFGTKSRHFILLRRYTLYLKMILSVDSKRVSAAPWSRANLVCEDPRCNIVQRENSLIMS